MVKLERDLSTQIKHILLLYNLTGEVEWYSRLQCGRINVGLHWLKLCDTGTPDYLALIRNRKDGLTALFIEAKSTKGKLSKEQKEFKEKYNRKSGFAVITITDINELVIWIAKNAKNFVNSLPKSLEEIK